MPSSVGLGQQSTQSFIALGTASPPTLQGGPTGAPSTGVTTVSASVPQVVDGLHAVFIELRELNVGAATVRIQGSHDGLNWYVCGYQRVDNQAAPARSVTDIALTQNTGQEVQVLDAYPLIRVNLIANTGSVFARVYGLPV